MSEALLDARDLEEQATLSLGDYLESWLAREYGRPPGHSVLSQLVPKIVECTRAPYGAGLNSMTTGGSNYFYLLDGYSGVANLTSSSGATEWTYTTDPFGTGTATKNDPSAPTNVMRFDGQFLDPATSLYNLRARTYDPGLSRFLQIDPLTPPIRRPQIAAYVYAGDSPTVLSDPSGMDFGCWGNLCVSDALKGAANFGAGSANFVTSTVTLGHVHVNAPFCGPGLHASYMSGEWTAGAEVTLYSLGEIPYDPASESTGWSSWLFGRGGDPAVTGSTLKGVLNSGPLRIGWGWKEGIGEVFRMGLGRAHFDIWPNGLWP